MTTTNKAAVALGRLGGKKSVKIRFGGKTKSEISELMRNVRLSRSEKQEAKTMANELVTNLNNRVTP